MKPSTHNYALGFDFIKTIFYKTNFIHQFFPSTFYFPPQFKFHQYGIKMVESGDSFRDYYISITPYLSIKIYSLTNAVSTLY